MQEATKEDPGNRTTTLKKILIISLAIGFFISTALLVLERLTDFSVAVMNWEMPGLTAAFIFWGMISNSAFLGVLVAWTVNGLVYSVPAFAVLGLFKAVQALTARP